jgi:hypothetical protein
MAKRVNNISYKGIRHTPSLVSDADGYASECANLSPDGSDLKPMPMPVMKNGYTVTIGARLVFVHQGVGYENYVELDADGIRLYLRDEEGNYLYYADPNSGWWLNESRVLSVDAIGDTIIISTTSGTEYLVYEVDNHLYKWLGQRPPMPVIEFRMHRETNDFYTAQETDIRSGDGDFVTTDQVTMPFNSVAYSKDYRDYDDVIRDRAKSLISKIEKQVAEESKFNQPFLLRFAYRTRTSDYIMQSPPILLMPSTDKCPFLCSTLFTIEEDSLGNNVVAITRMSMISAFATLQYKIHSIGSGLDDWSDIISGIDVFISTPILNYDSEAYTDATVNIDQVGYRWQTLPQVADTDFGDLFTNGEIVDFHTLPLYPQYTALLSGFCYKIKGVDPSVFHKKVTSTSVFHKVASFDLSELAVMNNFDDLKIDNLANLATLPTLEDDYNSHCAVSASLMQVYNSRLNMANISQKVFEGFANGFQPQSTNKLYPYKENNVLLFNIIVDAPAFRVKKNGKVITVRNYYDTNVSKLDYCSYLYYPDADCFEAVIYYAYGISSLTFRYLTIPMKRHEYLNGAYWYADMKCLGEYIAERMDGSIVAPTLSTDEERWYNIPNRFMMSSVGNPWHFPVANQFDIGRREIRALSINAENMDAPQFGQNPIYVFSADGIWTIAINADGTFNKLSYVSGDVLSEKWTIGSSPTASAQQTTFFKTSRSIMAVIGSQVKDIGLPMKGRVFNPMRKLLPAVSVIDGIPTIGTESYWLDVINGVCDDLPFADFASSSRLMYDYRNNRLLLYPGTEKIPYLYVYDIAHDFWSKMLPLVINEGPTSPTKDEYNQRDNSKTYTSFISVATIGSKPVLQDNQGHIWYVGEQPDENDIQVRQFGFYVSRPMRFGTDDMKTLTRVVHDQQISSSYEERVAMALYGSRDGNNYYKISTLKGTSYKFFIVVLYTHIYPSSRYAYTAFEWEPRMTDKIR